MQSGFLTQLLFQFQLHTNTRMERRLMGEESSLILRGEEPCRVGYLGDLVVA